MNSIVCNSSPIIALSSIDCFTLLPQLFQKIYIPEAVLQEVTFGSKKQVALQLDNNVFERYQVKNKIIVDKLYGKLHYGEIEVIIAVKELGLSDVILDDLAARKVAETFLLQPIGTVGLLLLAKEEGFIDKIKPYIDQLIDKNFRISKKVYERFLRIANEF